MEFPNLDGKLSKEELQTFADCMIAMGEKIGMKVSARGWCYLLEGERIVNKDQFDRAETYINKCRKDGLLPVDFVAEEVSREFSGVETPDDDTLQEHIRYYVQAPLQCAQWYVPDWWENETYYIQMLVEKVDMKNIFEPVCQKYCIPIANSKGWSSILQRAIFARRFKEAENKGLQPVLLYCGDHDPDGLRIGDFIKSNLADCKDIVFNDGETGYDPENLIVDRFGLDFKFIQANRLTWIDNLITGRKKNLASPLHKNFNMPYVQNYLKKFGERKCEANAVLPIPDKARALCKGAIEKYLGPDAEERFKAVRQTVIDKADDIYEQTGLKASIQETLDFLDNYEG